MNKEIEQEVMLAYADCRDHSDYAMEIRNLEFKASDFVSRDEAKRILLKANVYYNAFEPDLLNRFPKDCKIKIAREGSVCLYVKGNKLPKARSFADEIDKWDDGTVRYWWD